MTKQEVRYLLGKEEKSERVFEKATYETMDAKKAIKAIQEDLDFTNDEMSQLYRIILGQYSPQQFSRSWYSTIISDKVNGKAGFYKDMLLKFLFD